MSVRHSDIARVAGVSASKVSRALSGKSNVLPSEAERIRAIAEGMGYQDNRLARGIRQGNSRIIGCIVNDLTNPFNHELVAGIESVAAINDYGVLISDCLNGEYASIKRFIEYQVDAMVVTFKAKDPATLRELRRFTGSGRPVMTCYGADDDGGFGKIGVDKAGAVGFLVGHLTGLGHTRIAFAGCGSSDPGTNPRLRGYLDGMDSAGLRVDPKLVLAGKGYSDDFEGGRRIGSLLPEMAEGPTAVIAYNDIMAIGIISGLRDKGCSVPGDISVCGFDGIKISACMTPELTTISTHNGEWGRKMAGALLRMANGSDPIKALHPWVFVPGGTVGPPGH